jgi:hypothetical protein
VLQFFTIFARELCLSSDAVHRAQPFTMDFEFRAIK